CRHGSDCGRLLAPQRFHEFVRALARVGATTDRSLTAWRNELFDRRRLNRSMQPMKYPGHGVFGRSASYLDAEHGGRASTQILRASTVGTATDRGGRRQRFAHRRAARIGADQRRDEQATVPYAFWTRRRGSDTIKLLRSSVREHSTSSRAAPQPAARSFFVPVIESKFVRKL